MSDEYESEPVPGLPAYLPEGEQLLWQGAPQWTSVARTVFHAGLVAAYFGVLIFWRIFEAIWTGADASVAIMSASWLLVVAAAALGVISLLAWLTARTTIYSITSQRVVMRYGIALPIAVNLPFKAITSANLKLNRDGSGDIALELNGNGKPGYVHLWPHARPWHLKATQPMFRGLADPTIAANTLSKALADALPDGTRNHVVATESDGSAAAPSSAALGAT